MKEHRVLRIYGRVQGVLYRTWTKKQALCLGLTGMVRNEPDGSVCIEVEGDKAAIDALVVQCKKGPMLAAVTTIRETRGTLKGYTTFTIEL